MSDTSGMNSNSSIAETDNADDSTSGSSSCGSSSKSAKRWRRQVSTVYTHTITTLSTYIYT
jgi:hypothetical protein